MPVDTIECGFCDVEFDIIYTEEAHVKYCPFCGEDLDTYDEETDWVDNYEWEEEEE